MERVNILQFYVLLVAFFVILGTIRGLMVSARRSSGDVAHAHLREEEIGPIQRTRQIRTRGACT